MKKHMKWQSK